MNPVIANALSAWMVLSFYGLFLSAIAGCAMTLDKLDARKKQREVWRAEAEAIVETKP